MADPNSARERYSGDAGLVPWSVFERALAAHVADRDRIARAIADADPLPDEAPEVYRRMAEAAMSAMEAEQQPADLETDQEDMC